ncbi:MAG TPA: hypothetical protein PKZ59_01200 [Candidatus Hydrogenedentes bacterium]|nr:hypothetical protein [Candidatus Hydrogenedentota bacterium]
MNSKMLFLLWFSALFTLPFSGLYAQEENTLLYSARDFGVVPDTEEDMGPVFRALIKEAIDSGRPSVILLEKGCYRISGGDRHYSALVIEKARNMTVRGEGDDTELIFTDPRQGAFFVGQSENVFIESLSIDYDPLPFTQGTVLALSRSEGWFDLAVQENFPLLSETWFSDAPKPHGQWGMIFDRNTKTVKAGAADFIFMELWKQISRRVWRMYPVDSQKDRLTDMQMGDRFVQLARYGNGGALFFWRSFHCGASQVTVYASQSVAVGSLESDRTQLRKIKVYPKPESGRFLSTNSDGVHSQQDTTGPLIEACSFERMADDGVNIYSRPCLMDALIDSNVIRIGTGGYFCEGDKVQIVDPVQGALLLESTIVRMDRQEDGRLRLTLKDPLVMLRPGIVDWQVYNLSRCGADFVIKDTVFMNHRRHGMMLKSTDGTVENICITNVGGFGIVIGNDPEWPEGVIPARLAFSDIRIEHTGYSRWYGSIDRGAAIQILTRTLDGRMPLSRAVNAIRFDRIAITEPPGAGIAADGAENIVIEDASVVYPEEQKLPRKCSALEFGNVGNLYLDKVSVKAKGVPLQSGILFGNAAEPGEKGVFLNEYHFEGTAPAEAILDKR